MNLGKRKRIVFGLPVLILVGFSVILVGFPRNAGAVPSSATGVVYMMRDSSKVQLPGLKVWRMDYHENFCSPVSFKKCWGVNDGVETTTYSDFVHISRNYGMGNNGNIPGVVPLSVDPFSCTETEGAGKGSTHCPTGPMGAVSNRGVGDNPDDCVRLNWCGFNCGSNPHKWTPYFPDGYDWDSFKSAYPEVYVNEESMTGGGKFVAGRQWPNSCGGENSDTENEWWVGDVPNIAGISGCDFEWIPGTCPLSCTLSANPGTVSHYGGGTITLTADITGDYDTVSWRWVRDDEGVPQECGVLMPDPADKAKAYVTFLTGDVCTGEVVAIVENSCSASCPTIYHIINNPPRVRSVVPDSGISGTETDDDNGPTCSDNNPQVFSVTYSDADGCGDISSANVWIDDVAPTIEQQHSSVHAGIKRDGTGWEAYGLQCTNRCDDIDNYYWNVGGDEVTDAEPTEPYLYFPSDSSTHSDCLLKDGDCLESVAGVAQYAATCFGDALTVKYRVWFDDELIGHDLDIYGYVEDTTGEYGGWDDVGDRQLDFVPPVPSAVPQHYTGDPSDTIRFEEDASDNDINDVGLRSIIDRRYQIKRGGDDLPSSDTYYQIALDKDGLGGEPIWEVVTGPVPSGDPGETRPPFKGGDVIKTEVSAVDMACNMGTATDTSHSIGHKWIQTRLNDVYGYSGIYDPIQLSDDPRVPLSEHWLGATTADPCSSSELIYASGRGTKSGWCSNNYDDDNRRAVAGEWYETMERIAKNSTFVANKQGGNFVSISAMDYAYSDGVYLFTGGSLVVDGSCNGKKVVFIPEGANVVIHPPFERAGDGDACLFIAAKKTITAVAGGLKASDDEDKVHAAFITDGIFRVDPDNSGAVFDRLYLEGFVFSDRADFLRDLVFAGNLTHPAELLSFDARYFDLLRGMLGRREFESFECGIVGGSVACDGWYQAP